MILVHGTMESKKVAQIYKHGLLPSAKKLFGAQKQNWKLNEEKNQNIWASSQRLGKPKKVSKPFIGRPTA